MSDRICLMNHGRIEQLGTPSDLYFRPRTLFVADFLGESNLLEGTVERLLDGEVEVALAQPGCRARATAQAPLAMGARVQVMVRPQNITVGEAGDHGGQGAAGLNALRGRVLDSMITGSLTKLYVSPPGGGRPLVMCYPTSAADARHEMGDELTLQWQSRDAVAVPESA